MTFGNLKILPDWSTETGTNIWTHSKNLRSKIWYHAGIKRDKTMVDKLINIPNEDPQNYACCYYNQS